MLDIVLTVPELVPEAAALVDYVQAPLDRSDPALIATPAPSAEPKPARRRRPILPPSPENPPPNVRPNGVFAGAIRVEGGPEIPVAAFAPVISPFVGHRLRSDDLRELLAAVSGVAHAKGYVLAQSAIPQQTLRAGVLRVALDLGRVDEVRLTGARDRAVQRILNKLCGPVVTKRQLERRLLQAGDLPGVSLGDVKYTTVGGVRALVVPVRRKRFDARASIDNRGLSILGPVRAQAGLTVNGVFDSRDALGIDVLTTPDSTRELRAVSLRYARQVGSEGLELGGFASLAHTRPRGAFRIYDERGSSLTWGASATLPVVRSRSVSLWASAEVDHVESRQRALDTLIRRDRFTSLTLSLNGFAPLAGGRLRAGVGVTQGLDAFGATRSTDLLASRLGADPAFSTLNVWANWSGKLAGPLSARLAVAAQAARTPLLAYQQLSIGGPTFGRGYDYSERSGDQGVLGSVEIQDQLTRANHGWIRSLQLFSFADAGVVSDIHASPGAGALYSAGGGVRWRLPHGVAAEVEAAYPLGADRFESHDRSPRISFNVGVAF